MPQGANTGLVGAASPDDSGLQVILSMERIRGVIDIDPVDGVIQAWAGTRLSDLNQALAPHGLCFPSISARTRRWAACWPPIPVARA
jgi:FAD/FMN-containing dehydrogenase